VTEHEAREGAQQTGPGDFSENLQLFLAVRRGDTAEVTRLLDRRPELVDAEEDWSPEEARAACTLNADRGTALVRAAERNDLDTVKVLIERGADVNHDCGCAAGESALWVAVAAKCPEIARMLAERGADVNRPAFVGHGPLHVAAMRGWDDLVTLLLEFGADREQRDDGGRTPLDWARENEHHSVVRLLDSDATDAETIARPAGESPSSRSAFFETGIKTIDLLAPLRHGDLIRWDPALACTHMVFLAELTQNLLRSGYREAIWAGFEDDYVNLRELRHALGELGNPDLVTPMFASGTLSSEERRQHVERVREYLDQRRRDAPGRYLVVFYQDQQQMADHALAFPALNQRGEHAVTAICATPVQFPSPPLEVLALRPPLDARVAHDETLTKRRMSPAMNVLVTTSVNLTPEIVGAAHVRVSAAARAILERYEQLDPDLYFPDLFTFTGRDRDTAVKGQRLHAFITQPLKVTEVFSGMRGERVPLAETLRGVQRILDGELDDVPLDEIFYSGRRTRTG